MSDEQQKTSATSLDKIPVLDSHNWAEFKRRAGEWLVLSGYDDILEDIDPPSADLVDGRLTKERRLWNQRERRACTGIRARLNVNNHTLVEKETSLRTLLETLETNCKNQGTGMLIDLIRKFWSLRLQDYKSVTEYAEEFRQVDADLARISTSAKRSDLDMVIRFMDGLDPSYNNHVADFQRNRVFVSEEAANGSNPNAELKIVSFNELVRATLTEEQRLKREDERTAMLGMTGQLDSATKPDQRVVDWCTKCNIPGHKLANCFHEHKHLRPPGWKPRGEKGRGKKGEKGEKGSESRSKKRARKDSDESPADNEIFAVGIGSPEEQGVPKELGMLSSEDIQNGFIYDSGCSHHCAWNQNSFVEYTPLQTTLPIKGIGGAKVVPIGRGTVRIETDRKVLMLRDVYHCPSAGVNLVSSGQLQLKGYRFGHNNALSRGGGHWFEVNGHKFTTTLKGRIYLLDLRTTPSSTSPASVPSQRSRPLQTAAAAYSVPRKLQRWHIRMGHLAEDNLRLLADASHGMDLDKAIRDQCTCESCILRTMRKKPHNHAVEPGRHPMELVWFDLIGPLPITGAHGERYLAHAHCDKTKFGMSKALKTKKQAFEFFLMFKKRLERAGQRIRRVRTDNGELATLGLFKEYCLQNGIIIEPTVADNPEQNGGAEIYGYDIWRKTETTLHSSGIPDEFWPEVSNTAQYLANRTPHSALNGKTPFFALNGVHPHIGHIRIIGSTAYNLKPGHKKKLADRVTKGRLIGFEGDTIYRILTPEGKIIRGSNVHIKELLPDEMASPTERQMPPLKRPAPDPSLDENVKRQRIQTPSQSPSRATSTASVRSNTSESETLDNASRTTDDLDTIRVRTNSPSSASAYVPRFPTTGSSQTVDESTEDEDSSEILSSSNLDSESSDYQPTSPTPIRQDAVQTRGYWQRTVDALNDHGELDVPVPPSPDSSSRSTTPDTDLGMWAFLAKTDTSEPLEPKTWKQAKESSQWNQWKQAAREEYESLVQNQTWELVDRPKDRKVLRAKWVWKMKRGAHGQIVRYKARWVVKGFEQIEGIDYLETFASVVKPMSYKAIFAIVAALDWELEQMDVKTAFLYGLIDVEIYVEQPQGCATGKGKVCRLRKALYGLKQAPRVWYNTLTTFLKTLGYDPLDSDMSVFTGHGLIIAIYVDDLLIAGPDKARIQGLKTALSSHFKMTDLGPCSYYLGMEVTRDRLNRTLRLSQRGYLEKVLEQFGMQDSKPVATPMETSAKHMVRSDDHWTAKPEDRSRYQSAVGFLMYAMLGTRPDLAYAVSVVSRFASNPNEHHWSAVKRILRYIKGTLELNLVFSGKLGNLTGYSDADWAGDHDTRRSTSGYVFNVGSGAISWSSKRQPTVALSSCESEYVGQTNAIKEAIWLRRFLSQIKPDQFNTIAATVIFCDNQGAIALTKNPVFHSRTKHIDIHQHFGREKVQSGEVELTYTPTELQVADGLTKALDKSRFLRFRAAIGVV